MAARFLMALSSPRDPKNPNGCAMIQVHRRDSGALLLELDSDTLVGATLPGAVLLYGDLHGADVRRANLRGADLCQTDLRGATFRGACLTGADVTLSSLMGADFGEALLADARLQAINKRADARAETNFAKADLT